MNKEELIEFYNENAEFKAYIERFLRNHPEHSIEDVFDLQIVQSVAEFQKQQLELNRRG